MATKTVDQSSIANQLAAKTNTKFENFNSIIKKELADNFPAIKSLVPKHMTPERLARITLTAISRTPKLAECTPPSIVGAVMNCATLGLEPNLIGHAYLVPFYNGKTGTMECQFQIGYKGQIDLIRRTGDVAKIYAETVYENDLFVYIKGEDKRLVHVPFDMLRLLENFIPDKNGSFMDLMIASAIAEIKSRDPKDQGRAVRHYSAYRLKDGSFDFTTMTVEQSLAHANKFSKSKSKGKLTGPWVEHFDSMCKKTCIKEMAKYMPISIEVQEKLALDEAILKPRKDNGIESDNIFDVDYRIVEEEQVNEDESSVQSSS
ncbi:recombinase RecT [Paenibacillus thiaminolyticus]|uniref:recombinase RecT n=1 Tax=Paenibacillus thiaminolyticus TaxID=49283 RepID=UPI001163CD9A|nr:recombinase RecT [Paenibacillus thiaminolyticus]NGP58184.1 recombinase RecT [Paenibacillus thiaminolyticus]